MKLFQRLLVAPAALGLMAPMAANADITSASNESEVIQARVDSVEAQLEGIQAGGFSSSTTLSGSSAFVVGYTDDDFQTPAAYGADQDQVTFNYQYQLDVNSSFTGEDLLYAKIETGNFLEEVNGQTDVNDNDPGRFSNEGNGDYLAVSNQNGDGLAVEELWYQFPVGDSLTVWVGPKIENSTMLASAPSIYKPVTKQFALGGNASTYGSETEAGFGAAYTQQVEDPSDGRWALSVNYTGKGAKTADAGLLDEDSQEFFLTKVEYGTPQWQVSAAFASKTNGNGYDGLYHTPDGQNYSNDLTSIGLRGYWKPDESGAVPQVQVGYDVASVDDAAVDSPDEMEAWMIGLGWTDLFMDGNTAGIAFGSRQNATSYQGTKTKDSAKDNTVWEAYYSFKVNDGITITPAIFGGSDVQADEHDVNGAVLLTEFRF